MEQQDNVQKALIHLVGYLPPKERSCLLLKEVFEYSLQEISAIVGSTLGGVKASLYRARTKLEIAPDQINSPDLTREQIALFEAYILKFNQKDWNGLQELIRKDARLEVIDTFNSTGIDQIVSKYFGTYSSLSVPWKFRLSLVDQIPTILQCRKLNGFWKPFSAVQLQVSDEQKVSFIRDYSHVPYLLEYAKITQYDT